MLEIDRTLDAWAAQGDTDAAHKTLADIRVALGRTAWPYGVTYDAYLAGSYATGTNTTDDGIVDVVCELTSTFAEDTTLLPTSELEALRAHYEPKPYGLNHLVFDAFEALRAYYGAEAVSTDGAFVRIAAGPYNLAARVLPCVQHRRYLRFLNVAEEEYEAGVAFRDAHGGAVWYPRAHVANVATKNVATDGWFLGTVRLFKRAAAPLISGATSWRIESLLSNVPDGVFGFRIRETVEGAVRWLAWAEMGPFRCADGRTPLFGPDAWSVEDARRVVTQLRDLIGVRPEVRLEPVVTLDRTEREQQPR